MSHTQHPQTAPAPHAVVDPVCGMQVDEARARAGALVSEHGGEHYFFCSPACKAGFDANPGDYLPPAR